MSDRGRERCKGVGTVQVERVGQKMGPSEGGHSRPERSGVSARGFLGAHAHLGRPSRWAPHDASPSSSPGPARRGQNQCRLTEDGPTHPTICAPPTYGASRQRRPRPATPRTHSIPADAVPSPSPGPAWRRQSQCTLAVRFGCLLSRSRTDPMYPASWATGQPLPLEAKIYGVCLS